MREVKWGYKYLLSLASRYIIVNGLCDLVLSRSAYQLFAKVSLTMPDKWFEIADENINVEEVERRVQARLARCQEATASVLRKDPVEVAGELWREIIDPTPEKNEPDKIISLLRRDYDIVPRHYTIDWQVPLLGPINALLRRLINAEIRRFLLPSLERQSFLNRQLLQVLQDVAEENRRLRQEIENLHSERK